jgi:hypothetical protein
VASDLINHTYSNETFPNPLNSGVGELLDNEQMEVLGRVAHQRECEARTNLFPMPYPFCLFIINVQM